jgi:hypothetical protein
MRAGSGAAPERGARQPAPAVPITPSAGGGAAAGCAVGVEDPPADTKAHLRAVRPERIQPAFGMAVMRLSCSGVTPLGTPECVYPGGPMRWRPS